MFNTVDKMITVFCTLYNGDETFKNYKPFAFTQKKQI